MEAEHDGYCQAPRNITHRRTLLHVYPDVWVVVDDLIGPPSEHTFDTYFHFPASSNLSIEHDSDIALRVNARAASARLRLLMCASAPIEASLAEGQMDPIQGWVSPAYGKKMAAPALRVRMRSAAPASGMFIMLPSHSGTDSYHPMVLPTADDNEGRPLATELEQGRGERYFCLLVPRPYRQAFGLHSAWQIFLVTSDERPAHQRSRH